MDERNEREKRAKQSREFRRNFIARVCVCVCVRACVRACACVCVCVVETSSFPPCGEVKCADLSGAIEPPKGFERADQIR